ncbi:hypothetical protein H4R19_005095, partial [Coemansia spiralis]
MSEEGEAEVDAGQIADTQPDAGTAAGRRQADAVPGHEREREAPDAPPHAAAMGGAHGHPDARPGDDWGHAGYDTRHDADEYDYPRELRPHSRASSRGRDYPRRGPEYDAGYADSRAARRRDSREDEGDYRGAAYRPGRAGEREGYRAGYYRRYEREYPRFKRRESGRGAYPRGGYGGGGGSSEGGDEEYLARRDMDKERAIEELRLRVRTASDRPPEEGRPGARDRSPPASQHLPAMNRYAGPRTDAAASGVPPPPTTQPPGAHAAGAAASDSAYATVEDRTQRVESGPPADMDDLEEGEHVEDAMEVDLPQEMG